MKADRICIAVLCFEKDVDKLKNIVDFLRKAYYVEFVTYRRDIWRELMKFDCIVAYIASGIIIRGISKHLRSKWLDPAVVVLDKPLKHAIVLLGGHRYGNEVAIFLSQFGIEPVITTSMEFRDGICVGVGFRKNANENDIMNAIEKAIEELGLSVGDIRIIATVEGKEGSAIVKVVETLRKPLLFVKKDDLNKMDLPETSARRIGVKNVAEGCALFFAREKRLLLPKRVFGGVTIAIAR